MQIAAFRQRILRTGWDSSLPHPIAGSQQHRNTIRTVD
jgi:hypothetical protein